MTYAAITLTASITKRTLTQDM